MGTVDFGVGDLIWAKMKGCPFWPGKIIEPPEYILPSRLKNPHHYVYFFGSDNHAWVLDENIVPHDDIMVQNASKKKSVAYQSAIETIVSMSKDNSKKENYRYKIIKKEELSDDEQSPLIKTGNQTKAHSSVKKISKISEEKGLVSIKKAAPIQRKTSKKQTSSSVKYNSKEENYVHKILIKEENADEESPLIKTRNQNKIHNFVSQISKTSENKVYGCSSVKKAAPIQRKTSKKQTSSSVKYNSKEGNYVHKILKKEENADEESPLIKTRNQNKTHNFVSKVSKTSEKKVYGCSSVKKEAPPIQRKSFKKQTTSSIKKADAVKKRKRPLIENEFNVTESSISYPSSQRLADDYAELLASIQIPLKKEVDPIIGKSFKKQTTSVNDADATLQRKSAKKQKQPLRENETNVSVSCESYPDSEEDDYSELLASFQPTITWAEETRCCPAFLDGLPPSLQRFIPAAARPTTPVLDLSNVSEILKCKEIVADSKKIGFLGLGHMGQNMVKNLLISGHCVTVWNRTPEKMDIFLKAGASKAETPSDVVQGCDIIFCCVSDAKAVRDVVFGKHGVLKGLEYFSGRNKGYVEMTVIDPETSQEIEAGITSKGGRYLEAPIAGSMKNAAEGTLMIYTAGDQTLFQECETCFCAMGEYAFYMNSVVGTAAKINLIRSMFHGTMFAAMAEAMALLNHLKLSQYEFLISFESGPLNCKAMLEIGQSMLLGKYSTPNTLKHVQNNLDLGILLCVSAGQPTPVASAANEMYKCAKQFYYAYHNASTVYEGAK